MESTITCQVNTGGTLDNIMMIFCDAMFRYGNESTALASKIFMILFALEFLWQLAVKKVFTGDIEKLWVFFFTRSSLGFFFMNYLVNVDTYRSIIIFIARFGARVGGFNVDFQGQVSNIFVEVTPSSMVGYFTCIADVVHRSTDTTGVLEYITVKYLLALSLLLFFVVLICISFLLMEVFIKTYFLLYIGFILTGFAGSSWTINYWQKYLKQVSAMALEFLTQCILLGVLKSQADSWTSLLTKSHGDLVNLAGAFINMLGVALIFLMLMYSMPRWVGNNLSGEVRLRLDDQFKSVSGFMSGGGI